MYLILHPKGSRDWRLNAQNFGGRNSHWALDILNVSSAYVATPYVPAVPEPETYAMFMAGLGVMAWRLRRAKRKNPL
ncbi:putative secreted protein with PEP-CTERM sorting signal [Nitrosospira sp. Nsp2]|uniref:PEP-CTERM sorting domain-containing protein n=1 Tax=Nitrosospira sp. Nsp2 TaxID=136548 RepID=UPI000D2FDA10|nr:PEP-CTERM sorting domain-containing protein [Nitrosospira sp. Nsp2]PTR16485.1 putative secreted protein with PEP-CTERM sorting signal [Nitrosospira sp. Nsp2]